MDKKQRASLQEAQGMEQMYLNNTTLSENIKRKFAKLALPFAAMVLINFPSWKWSSRFIDRLIVISEGGRV